MDTNKIYNATNSKELSAALTECMNEAVDEWWHELDDEVKKAIRMLGFSRSVISSIMFFPNAYSITSCDFGWLYNEWINAFKKKSDDVIEQNLVSNFPSLTTIMTYRHCMARIYNEVKGKIVPLGLSAEIQEAAIQDLLSRDNDFQMYKKQNYEEIEDLRKIMLWHAIERIQNEGE